MVVAYSAVEKSEAKLKKVQKYHQLVVKWESRALKKQQNAQIALQSTKESLIKAEARRVRLAREAERLRLTTLFKEQHDALQAKYLAAEEAIKVRREYLIKTAGNKALLNFNLQLESLTAKVTEIRVELESLQQSLKDAVYQLIFQQQKAKMMLVATTDYEVAKGTLELAIWK